MEFEALSDRERQRLQMLAYQVDGQSNRLSGGREFLGRLSQSTDLRAELAELGGALQARCTMRFQPLSGLEDAPLSLPASYRIREILTAVGYFTLEKRPSFREGVLVLENRKLELLFVTLDKSEGFHDRIAYHNYAVSAERFHWQTQNSAGPKTAAGRRYLEGATNGWPFQLFVRRNKGESYRVCGPVVLEKANGAKPMSIHWKLLGPFPRLPRFFSDLLLRG